MNPEFLIWLAITPEAILPMVATSLAVAGGIAAGIAWVKRAPELSSLKSEIEGHDVQIKADRERIRQAEKLIDDYREQLRICREINMEMGIRIRQLEETSERDHDHPVP